MADGTIIYHDPKFGTSRKVLSMLRGAVVEPTAVDYLKTSASRDDLDLLPGQLTRRPETSSAAKTPVARPSASMTQR